MTLLAGAVKVAGEDAVAGAADEEEHAVDRGADAALRVAETGRASPGEKADGRRSRLHHDYVCVYLDGLFSDQSRPIAIV